MKLDAEALKAAFEEALPRNEIISEQTVAAIVRAYLSHILQGAEERVAEAIYDEAGGDIMWKYDLARAAIAAMIKEAG